MAVLVNASASRLNLSALIITHHMSHGGLSQRLLSQFEGSNNHLSHGRLSQRFFSVDSKLIVVYQLFGHSPWQLQTNRGTLFFADSVSITMAAILFILRVWVEMGKKGVPRGQNWSLSWCCQSEILAKVAIVAA